MSQHKVGGEVDAICTRCKLFRADGRPQLLAHTILAMVGTKIARVRCNTCDSDHVYRSDAPSSSSSSGAPRAPRAAASSSAETSRAAVSALDEIRKRDPSTLQKYSIKVSFKEDDFLEHPTFGQGIVTAVRGDKIEVAFKSETRTLVHARADGLSQARPSFQRPSAAPGGPADKPLPEDAGS
jgi:hypothetical protein